MIVEDRKLIRTFQSYENDLLKNDFPITGIRESCLIKCKISITENKAVDMMHDFSEGIATYTVAKVLETMIREKILSLGIINNRIEAFPYNDIEKSNKLRPLYFTQSKQGGQKLKVKQHQKCFV